MSKVYFIRTAPYDYLIPGMSLYDSFDAVSSRRVEVRLKETSSNFPLFNTQYKNLMGMETICSPRERSVETAKFISNKPQIADYLSEIRFNMKDFIAEEEFNLNGQPDVNNARIKFVKALISNKLQESYEDVIKRVEKTLDVLIASDSRVVVSHGFFMKVVEAYIRDRRIKDNPRRLLKYFDGQKETFGFCEGFECKITDKKISFSKYIRNNHDY